MKQEFNKISDKNNYTFNIDFIYKVLANLRLIKNRIFFGNVTDKLIGIYHLD
mgnify:CR=1